MGATIKGKESAGNGKVREELAGELKHLRALVREVGENFILRREGEIETIITNLAATPLRKLRAAAPGMLHDIRTIRLKPAKGRLKDLKGIDALIEELTDRIIGAQDDQSRSG
jgi:hypothetical protein